MASRSASRTVVLTISASSGQSGEAFDCAMAGAGWAATGALSDLPSEVSSATGAGAVSPLPSAPASGTSSPSSTRMAMGLLTFTPSVPSAIRILPMMPSSTASNSIVALSVSISARMSPAETVSPSFTSHLASVPSSIVGESAGMRISVAMSVIPPQASSSNGA
jgi:hypothetical protein